MRSAVLGVDIGGTGTKLALVDSQGRILDCLRYPTRANAFERCLAEINERAEALAARNRDVRVEAAGIGIKSVSDYRRQIVCSSSIFPELRDFDVTACLRERFQIPVVMDNDVNAMAVGELLFGWGRERRDFMYVNIGTGLGGCPILEGRPYRGARGWAGELCNIRIPDGSGEWCSLESVVSGAGCDGLVRALAGRWPESVLTPLAARPEPVRTDQLFRACRDGDALAREIVERMLSGMALAVLNMEALLDCGLYVFGGGVAADGWFLRELDERVKTLSRVSGVPDGIAISTSRLGAGNAGAVGAAALAYYGKWREP